MREVTEARVRVLEIGPENRTAHQADLEAMHRHRHRLFVEVLGWAALARDDQRDIDAFDGPDATYLIARDDGGVLRGSLRLLPTAGPHLLSDVFPRFVDGPVPRGPTLMEWTRHAPGDPAWPPAVNAAARLALHLGVLEYAAHHGVTGFTAVLETWLVRGARAMGWACIPLGAAQPYGEGEAIAVLNPVRPGHLERLRAKAGLSGPVLLEGAACSRI
jgi:N-acyl-L-homoserine lactone synthetase